MDYKDISLKDLANKNELEVQSQTEVEKEAEIIEVQVQQLTPEERKKVDEIKKNINLMDSKLSLEYGVNAQRGLAEFSDTILTSVRTKDTGEVGNLMVDLMDKVNGLEIESLGEKKGIFSNLPFVSDMQTKINRLMGKYEVVEVQIDKIEQQLDNARTELVKDVAVFDKLYEKNFEYFKDLQAYILAGEEALEETRNEVIPRLRAEAEESGDQMDAQLVKDFEDTLLRFEKKIYDLKLSKTMAIQTAPQIKLIQNNDKLLVDKIQTAILNTIPLWKSQMVIALGLSRQQNALKMQREVSNTTNELLRKNSELLKQNTTEVLQESERGIIDIETLQKVNEDLIVTIEEGIRIQQEGRQKRAKAEIELANLENKLKNTLLKNMDTPSITSEEYKKLQQ